MEQDKVLISKLPPTNYTIKYNDSYGMHQITLRLKHKNVSVACALCHDEIDVYEKRFFSPITSSFYHEKCLHCIMGELTRDQYKAEEVVAYKVHVRIKTNEEEEMEVET